MKETNHDNSDAKSRQQMLKEMHDKLVAPSGSGTDDIGYAGSSKPEASSQSEPSEDESQ